MNDCISEIPYGYCHCGCGQKTNISKMTSKKYGQIKGIPVRYISGHHVRCSREQRIIAFWNNVNKNGSIPLHCPELGQCWEWTVSCDKNGYGKFSFENKDKRAHRFSWELINGDIPNSFQILHKCDNPKCVRVSHLMLGTSQDNIHDKQNKNRQAKGEKQHLHKLAENEVRVIRHRYIEEKTTMQLLANEYDVTKSTISRIILRKTWKHI